MTFILYLVMDANLPESSKAVGLVTEIKTVVIIKAQSDLWPLPLLKRSVDEAVEGCSQLLRRDGWGC